MIDLHTHILPGLDDGASDMNEAVEMCRMAESDGITTMVATPHTGNGVYVNRRDRILAAVAELNSRLSKEGINVRILPGADVHINQDMTGMIEAGRALTLNDAGRYLLVELPHQTVPPNLGDWIFTLKLNGITPIITHPERNFVIRKNMEELRKWVDLGALVQITAMSVTGQFGTLAQHSAHEMLKGNLVHAIASDAHSISGRPPILSRARDAVARLTNESHAHDLVHTYPGMILDGKPVEALQPLKGQEPGLMRRLLQLR